MVLFHVTANAEWSTLPLSGLFVEMLERLAVSSSAKTPEAGDLAGTTWSPVQVLDGFGALATPATCPAWRGRTWSAAPLGPDLRPGLYRSEARRLARNVLGAETQLTPAAWPAEVPVVGCRSRPSGRWAARCWGWRLRLLAIDVVASLALSGRLGRAGVAAAALAGLMLALPPVPGQAQTVADDEARAIAATGELVLAHVLTGDAEIDDRGPGRAAGAVATRCSIRTSVEPAPPMGVDLERDELAFFPLLYWPVTPDQPQPSARGLCAAQRLPALRRDDPVRHPRCRHRRLRRRQPEWAQAAAAGRAARHSAAGTAAGATMC